MAATSRRLRLPGASVPPLVPGLRWRPFRDLDPQPAVHQCRVEHGHDLHTAGVVGLLAVLRGQAGPAGVDRDRGQRGRVLLLTGFGELDADAWIGMGLALIAAVLAAIYVAFGERLRDHRPWFVHDVGLRRGGGFPAGAVPGPGRPLLGYAARDWLLIVAITVIAQIGGHSLMNAVVHRTSATVVSTAILFEAPGATILAAIFLGQSVGLSLVLGLTVMLIGLAFVIRGSRPRMPEPGCEIGDDSHLDIVGA